MTRMTEGKPCDFIIKGKATLNTGFLFSQIHPSHHPWIEMPSPKAYGVCGASQAGKAIRLDIQGSC